MAITVNRATLARQVNGEIEYIYPKTDAELVQYDPTQNIKEKIDAIGKDAEAAANYKVDKPLDENGSIIDGTEGQVLETNGDGTTRWVTRARVYVGSGEMPEGYDVQIDPEAKPIEIDKTLTIEGAVADAKAVGDAIQSINDGFANIDVENKVDKPIDINGDLYDGIAGQVLETNGDGSTSWVSRARVYVGSGDMPEGYDVQIDPNETTIEIDRTLSIDGAIAEASATGAAINNVKAKIAKDIEAHNTDPVAHTDIRAMITDAKEYILLKDINTGDEYKVYVEDGVLKLNPTVVKPIKLTVTTMPNKTSYNVKELFDPTGMVVAVTYNNGETKEVTGYTYPMTALTSNTTSVSIVYIEAGVTVTVEVPVTVIVECIGISITTNPTLTQYYIGESFNPAGMIVAATYSDGVVKAVTNYTYPTEALVKGMNRIEVTYVENGVTFTANVSITVMAKYISLSVTTEPYKTSYAQGQVFDPSGMVVKANYNDFTSKEVTGYTYSTAALTVETTSVTITYTENGLTHTASVPVSVTNTFNPTDVLKDFYYINNGLTYTISGWKGTKDGVASTEVVVPDSDKIVINVSE